MADYAKLAQDLLQSKFPLFGGFRRYTEYQSMQTPEYDVSDGSVDKGTPTKYYLWIILGGFSFTKNQSTIKQNDITPVLGNDRSALFPALDLAVVPKIGDQMIVDLITYRVIGLNADPAPAHRNLHIRPIDET